MRWGSRTVTGNLSGWHLKCCSDISFVVVQKGKEILSSIDKYWLGNTYRWWSDVMDIDPLQDLLKLNLPILVGIGEQDTMEPVESVRFLKSKFDEAGKNNLILKVYPDADHRLNGNGISYRNDYFAELSRLIKSSGTSFK